MSGKSTLLLAFLGIVVTLGGALSYFALVQVPWFRSGWPNLVIIVVGTGLGIYAATRGTVLPKVLAGFDVVLLLLFVFALTVAFRLPAATAAPQTAALAPDFSLPDHTGTLLGLGSFRGKGPVLLVFYRGHW